LSLLRIFPPSKGVSGWIECFFRYVRHSAGRELSADEKAALVALANNRSMLTERANTFFDQANELVQFALGQQNSDGVEKAFAALLASDQHSSLVKESLRERVEESGGVRPFVEGSISRAKIALANAHERLQRELEEIEGKRSTREASDVSLRRVSDDALFEGGVGAFVGGLGAVIGAAALPVTVPFAVVGGGAMVEFGG
jgi:hypothetical protein